jgi:hypothetical protein
MVEVIEKKDPHFRIQIYDLIAKKSRNITVANNSGVDVEELRKYIVDCLKKFDKKDKI